MAAMTSELITVLNDEMKIYDELIIYAQNKKAELIRDDIEEISKITNAEQRIITTLKKLEVRREEITRNLKTVLNDYRLTITTLIDKLSGEDKEALIHLKDGMMEKVGKLKEINEQNSVLITEGLTITEFSLNMLQGPVSENSYANEVNQHKDAHALHYFDTRK